MTRPTSCAWCGGYIAPDHLSVVAGRNYHKMCVGKEEAYEEETKRMVEEVKVRQVKMQASQQTVALAAAYHQSTRELAGGSTIENPPTILPYTVADMMGELTAYAKWAFEHEHDDLAVDLRKLIKKHRGTS